MFEPKIINFCNAFGEPTWPPKAPFILSLKYAVVCHAFQWVAKTLEKTTMPKERRVNIEDAMHAQASVSSHPNVVSNG